MLGVITTLNIMIILLVGIKSIPDLVIFDFIIYLLEKES